ncbi:MAG: hypothetical protein ACE1Y4_10905, partial [Lysobacterales bacterium]
EASIWNIWVQSDDQVIAMLMAQGLAAMNRNDLRAALGKFDQIVKIAPGFAEDACQYRVRCPDGNRIKCHRANHPQNQCTRWRQGSKANAGKWNLPIPHPEDRGQYYQEV